MRLCITGGGTGGHLYTGLALAEMWTAGTHPRLASSDIHFAGGLYGLEKQILPRYPYPYTLFDVLPFKGKTLVDKLKALLRLCASTWRAFCWLRRERPAVVIGIGGYVSAPVILASVFARIPRVIIEQNATPGLANRLLGKLASRVFVHFKEALPYFSAGKAVQTGNPIRPALRAALVGAHGMRPPLTTATQGVCDTPLRVEPTQSEGAIDVSQIVESQDMVLWKQAGQHRHLLLILGGSQGARSINRLIPAWLASLPLGHPLRTSLAIIHQAGKADVEATERAYAEHLHAQPWQAPIVVTAFLEPIAPYYHLADLIVARSGAGTICELAACEKPSILIPFPHAADNHQEMNARALVAVGAAELLLERDATPENFDALIAPLLTDNARLHAMGRAARALDFPGAGEAVWRECENLSIIEKPGNRD